MAECLVAYAITRPWQHLKYVCLDAVGLVTLVSNVCAILRALGLIPDTLYLVPNMPYPLKMFGVSLAGDFFCTFVGVSASATRGRENGSGRVGQVHFRSDPSFRLW